MKRSPLTILVAVLLLIIFGAMLFIFQVRQSEVAVVTFFDQLDHVETNAGAHRVLPWPIEKVYKLDQRIHSMADDKAEQILLPDQNTILLLTYTGWRISDAGTFFKIFPEGSVLEAEKFLRDIVRSAKTAAASRHNFSDFLSADEKQTKFTQIEGEILAEARKRIADKNYPIDLKFIQIKNIELPTAVSQAVFDRMKKDRAKRAAAITSDADYQSSLIRGVADNQASRLLADAEARAKEIRGQGQLQMVQSLHVMNQNPDFARFIMNLDMMDDGLGKNNTTLILDRNTTGMELLNNLKAPTAPAASPK